MSGDMIKTTIECDSCGRISEMEPFNGQSNFRLPAGWVTVKGQALPHRFDEIDKSIKPSKGEINQMVSRLVPNLHFCLECVTDKESRDLIKRENEIKIQAEIDRTIGFRVNRRQIMTEGGLDG